MNFTIETQILKDIKIKNARLIESVDLYFDVNDNIKFTVRKLNNNITSVQNHLGKFLKTNEITTFKNSITI